MLYGTYRWCRVPGQMSYFYGGSEAFAALGFAGSSLPTHPGLSRIHFNFKGNRHALGPAQDTHNASLEGLDKGSCPSAGSDPPSLLPFWPALPRQPQPRVFLHSLGAPCGQVLLAQQPRQNQTLPRELGAGRGTCLSAQISLSNPGFRHQRLAAGRLLGWRQCQPESPLDPLGF